MRGAELLLTLRIYRRAMLWHRLILHSQF